MSKEEERPLDYYLKEYDQAYKEFKNSPKNEGFGSGGPYYFERAANDGPYSFDRSQEASQFYFERMSMTGQLQDLQKTGRIDASFLNSSENYDNLSQFFGGASQVSYLDKVATGMSLYSGVISAEKAIYAQPLEERPREAFGQLGRTIGSYIGGLEGVIGGMAGADSIELKFKSYYDDHPSVAKFINWTYGETYGKRQRPLAPGEIIGTDWSQYGDLLAGIDYLFKFDPWSY